MKNVAVVIPYYSNKLLSTEQISLERMMGIFSNRDIFILTTNSLDVDTDKFGKGTKIIRVEDRWLASRESYNELLLSSFFYKLFSDYKYLLITQLDVYVFEDALDYFVAFDYDYYGAPWIYGYSDYSLFKRKVLYVGNGGYSLRKIENTINLLDSHPDILTENNEDLFFSSSDGPEYRIAPLDIALKFAFERYVKKCYELNENKWPTACHAWNKYNYSFIKTRLDKNEIARVNENDCSDDDLKKQDNYLYYTKLAKLLENDDMFTTLPQRINLFFTTVLDKCIVWGNGPRGKNVIHILKDSGITVTGIVDSNVNKQGNYYDHILISSPDEIGKNSKIIVATDSKWYPEIERQLNDRGLYKGTEYMLWNECIDSIKL